VVGLIASLAAQVDPAHPAVLLGHFSVAGAHWGSERNIMVGRDVTVPVSALTDSCWQYVALGHIHQHQDVNPGDLPPVVYAGSLERVDFGEEGQPKGFCWVELDTDSVHWTYVPLDARRFETVRVDVRSVDDPLAYTRASLDGRNFADAVVRLVIQMTADQEPRLRDADLAPLVEAAFYAQINREVDREARDRLADVQPADMTPSRLLERYLLAKGKDESNLEPYLAAAAEIFADPGET
jgi:exonuclease SbcD